MSTKPANPIDTPIPMPPETLDWLKTNLKSAYDIVISRLCNVPAGVDVLQRAMEAGVDLGLDAEHRKGILMTRGHPEKMALLSALANATAGSEDKTVAAIRAVQDSDPGTYYGLLPTIGPLGELIARKGLPEDMRLAKLLDIKAPNENLHLSRIATLLAAMKQVKADDKTLKERMDHAVNFQGCPDPLSAAIEIRRKSSTQRYSHLQLALREHTMLCIINKIRAEGGPPASELAVYQDQVEEFVDEAMGSSVIPLYGSCPWASRMMVMAGAGVDMREALMSRQVTLGLRRGGLGEPSHGIQIVSATVGTSFPIREHHLDISEENRVHWGNEELNGSAKTKGGETVSAPLPSTLMAFAVMRGSKSTIARLIAREDVNACHPHNGVTPLHIAAVKGDTATIASLLAAGANPDATDIRGRKPVEWAGMQANPKVPHEVSRAEVRAVIEAHQAKQKIAAIAAMAAAARRQA